MKKIFFGFSIIFVTAQFIFSISHAETRNYEVLVDDKLAGMLQEEVIFSTDGQTEVNSFFQVKFKYLLWSVSLSEKTSAIYKNNSLLSFSVEEEIDNEIRTFKGEIKDKVLSIRSTEDKNEIKQTFNTDDFQLSSLSSGKTQYNVMKNLVAGDTIKTLFISEMKIYPIIIKSVSKEARESGDVLKVRHSGENGDVYYELSSEGILLNYEEDGMRIILK